MPDVSFRSDGGFGPPLDWLVRQRPERYSLVLEMHHSRGAADPQRGISLAFGHGPFQRKGDERAPQTGEKKRGPGRMISNLNRDHFAGSKFAQQGLLEMTRLRFDLSKSPQHIRPCVEDGGAFPVPRTQSLLPRLGQAIGASGFHPLRASRSAPKFATRFQT